MIEPPLPVLCTTPFKVTWSVVAGVSPAVSVMLPEAETPPVPMVSGLCARMDTAPAGALIAPVVVTAPVLSTVILPPLLLMAAMASALLLVRAMLPLPELAALKLAILLPASVSAVPVCDWVLRVVAMIAPVWVIAPVGAAKLSVASVAPGMARLPLAWVMLALAPAPKASVPPLRLKPEFTVRLLAIFNVPPAMASPAAVSDARLVLPAAAS